MLRQSLWGCLALLVLATLALSVHASTASAASDTPAGTCSPLSASDRLACDVRAVVPATLQRLEQLTDGMSGESLTYQQFDGTAAWLMLVDTTHQTPMGLLTDDRYAGIRADLTDMINATSDRRLVSVQTYDGTIETLASFGASPGEAVSALDTLATMTADAGTRVGLYDAAREAIDELAALDADRKALVLFSDGLSGALGPRMNLLVRAARDSGVAIIGMAYTGGEADLANHLDLRRLATRTDGTVLYPAMMNQRLSDDNLRGFFATLENGGTLEVPADASSDAVLVRAFYSDGRMLDGELTLPMDR